MSTAELDEAMGMHATLSGRNSCDLDSLAGSSPRELSRMGMAGPDGPSLPPQVRRNHQRTAAADLRSTWGYNAHCQRACSFTEGASMTEMLFSGR